MVYTGLINMFIVDVWEVATKWKATIIELVRLAMAFRGATPVNQPN